MIMIDWILAGIAFLGVVLALGKYTVTRKQRAIPTKEVSIHACLCTQCEHFKAKESV